MAYLFSMDRPEDIVRLITVYPEFKVMYDELYHLCLNTEKVMEMFSKELYELDRNTAQYMMDEMQETIDKQNEALAEKNETIKTLEKEKAKLQEELKRITELEKYRSK